MEIKNTILSISITITSRTSVEMKILARAIIVRNTPKTSNFYISGAGAGSGSGSNSGFNIFHTPWLHIAL